jgi:hypothetical protein
MRVAGRRAMARAFVVPLVGILVGVVFARPAGAQEGDPRSGEDDQVVLTGGLFVPEGSTVGTAVVFNGPVVIEGTVRESLVVFNGRTEIIGTVGEDVVVFNGRVFIRSGAEIGGDVASSQDPEIEDGATIGGDQVNVATRFDFENLGFAGRVAWWIGYSVSTLVLGLLVLLLAPRLDAAIVEVMRKRMGASFGFGAATFFLVPIAAILLLITIVGIPLGLFVLLALALLYTIGYVAGAHALGRLIIKQPTSPFLAFLVGLGILRLAALIPFVGGLAWLLASILGLGVLVVSSRRAPVVVASPAPPPTPTMTPG